MPRQDRPSPDHRKTEHAAFMLPVFGALLLLPPLLDAFAVPHRLFGVPVEVVYLFTVWLLLIAGAAVMSRRLPRPERRPPQDEGRSGG